MDSMPSKSGPPSKGATGSEIRASSRAKDERPAIPTRRVFTPEYKQRIIHEVDQLLASGERGAVGALLRREGLHSMTVKRWRETLEKAGLAALKPQKRGPKPKGDAAATDEIARLEIARLRRQVERLQTDLQKAEIIIDVQKKLSALLGIQMPASPDEDEKS